MPRMHHAFQPSAERLESHILLSSTAIATFADTGSPIVETLSTDKTIYKVGQPIQITLTETNTTNLVVTSPSVAGVNQFTVRANGKEVWESKGGRLAATPFTLQPGQTHTATATWNGRANVGSRARSRPLTGTFQIDNTLANNSVTIAIDPRRGKGANAGVTDSVPNELLTLTN